MMKDAAIPQAPVPAGYRFGDIQLEMSLKPFWDASAETREAVCRELFTQWQPLCRFAESVSVMLWIGDGSEILEYVGDLDAAFDWGRYHGCANDLHAAPPATDSGDPGHDAIGVGTVLRDPERRGVHLRSYLYRPEPARFTFRWLRELVATLKRVGAEITGKPVYVGETFDIGPEFAISRFKYQWHPEICGGGALFGGKFIRCDTTLRGDQRTYAGFPDGIPEGTQVGAFLGRQCAHFFRDLGFDFLWLSNGFGFALEPWALTGAIFDGLTFDAGRARQTADDILRFWTALRQEFPDRTIRTRGTNLATGIDLASDASPLREIYRQVPGLEAPPNSPWAALDGDIGLELAGWMSHIAQRPGRGYRYRFYTHDPWWLNSPWLDRYQRQPHDLYLPLAVSRLEADGSVEIPRDLAFLSVDDSHGQLPVQVPVEVAGHLLHAREFAPDAPGPLVWVYPFDAFHDLTTGDAPDPSRPFFADWCVRGMIAQGLPVNTVADAEAVRASLAAQPEALRGSILLAPVLPARFGINDLLLEFARAGGRVLFFGPLADAPEVAEALGITHGPALEGDFDVALSEGETSARTLRHTGFLSAGGWTELSPEALVTGRRGEQRRAAVCARSLPGGGALAWVRGSLSTREFDPANPVPIKGPRLQNLDPARFVAGESLARLALARLGFDIRLRGLRDRPPIFCVHRNRNAFVFSGHQPDAAVTLSLRTGFGAPLFEAAQNRLADGALQYAGPTAWHHVCRCFAEGQAEGELTCRVLPPIQHGYTLRLLVSGARGATLHFFPEPGSEDRLEILRAPKFPYFHGDFVKPEIVRDDHGVRVTVAAVEGEILFSW